MFRKFNDVAVLCVCTVVMAGLAGKASALTTLVLETFDDDPAAGGRASVVGDGSRFISSPGTLTAHYDTSMSTSKMQWALGTALNQQTDFELSVRFSISQDGFFADPNGFAQVGFGLINEAATGNNRSGGPTFDGVNGSAYDIVTVDYFPNETAFGGPTLSPTVIETDDGVSGFFPSFDDLSTPDVDESSPGSVIFPFGSETDLTIEGRLPFDTFLDIQVTYMAADRLLAMRLPGVDINSVGSGAIFGGGDGDIHTIQSILPIGAEFSVDTFAITLWEDEFRFGGASVIGDVVFDQFEVRAEVSGSAVPEPACLSVIGLGALGFWLGVSRRRCY